MVEWRPLADYLTGSIDGWRFELVPVTLASVQGEIEARRLDFLITNPGHYVALADRHDLSVIATRERWADISGSHLSQFGTAIIVASDSPIASLNDLKGTRLAAISPDAFGGFQVAWSQMQLQGVDAFRDLASLRFLGFPHDEVIAAVARKEVDAGIIRGGLLEILAGEGKIALDDFRVLNAQQFDGFPYQVSSPLFAEWPFAALPSVEKRMCEQVLTALLKSQDPEISAKYGLRDLWSAPLSYESTRKLVGALAFAMAYSRRGAALPVDRATDIDPRAPAGFQQYEDKMKSLTLREREILQLICGGKQTRAIAGVLGISPKTVEFHRTNLLQKTQAGTMAHLVQIATRLGYDQGVSPG